VTKKHFVAIARIIRCSKMNGYGHAGIAWELARYFATTNKFFDRTKFFEACGITEDIYDN